MSIRILLIFNLQFIKIVNVSNRMSHKSSKNTTSIRKSAKSTIITLNKNDTKTVPISPISLDKNGNICLKILAKPNAKLNQITDVTTEGIGVQINAPPTDGEANAEIIKYLSNVLGLRKNDLSLDRGSKSRNKTIIICKNLLTIDQVSEKLQTECSNSN